MSIHAGRIIFALARRFDWWANKMVTEFEIGGLREDLVIVSRSGYATVVEIKVSRGDWQADRHKNRWPSKHIARFFYAVPHEIYRDGAGVPAHVQEHCGVLTLRGSRVRGGYDDVVEVRPARRLKAEKLPERTMQSLNDAFYYRFWRMHMERERARLFERPKITRAA